MAKASESTEKGDRGILTRLEPAAIQAADAQAAREAGASDVKAAQALNKNAHSGSAGGDQNLSFELLDLRDGKQKVVAARQEDRLESISVEELIQKGRSGDKFAVSIVQQMRAVPSLPDSERQLMLTRLQDTADKFYTRSGKADSTGNAQNIDTQAMRAMSPSNEVARSALEMKEGIEKYLPPGAERDRLIAQLKADVTPVLKGQAEQTAYPEPNDWQAFMKLSPEQQSKIVESFEKGSNEGQKEYEQRIEAVARSVPKGFYNFGKSIYDCASGAGRFLYDVTKDPSVGADAWHCMSTSLGKAFVDGIEISKFITAYAWTVGKDRNYSQPIEDLSKVMKIANEHWDATPLEVKTEKASELIAGMGLGAGIGAADKVARSGKLIEAVEEVAQATKGMTGAAKERAAKALGKFFDDLMQPVGDTGLPNGRDR